MTEHVTQQTPLHRPLSKGGTGARRAPQGALQPSAREPLPAEPHASLPFPSGSLVVLFSWLTKFDLGILIRSALVSALRAGVKNKGTFLLESDYDIRTVQELRGAEGREDHHDLHPCSEPGRQRRQESRGRSVEEKRRCFIQKSYISPRQPQNTT